VFKTDIKGKDKEEIKRIPIWISTATPIATHVDANESIQLQQRVKVWHFNKCIQHRTDSRTINPELSRRLIRKAPGFVRPTHFAFLWLLNFNAIISKIRDLDREHIRNIDAIDIPQSVVELASGWQTRLKDFWTEMENPVGRVAGEATVEEQELPEETEMNRQE